jgi:hypothetical protein
LLGHIPRPTRRRRLERRPGEEQGGHREALA